MDARAEQRLGTRPCDGCGAECYEAALACDACGCRCGLWRLQGCERETREWRQGPANLAARAARALCPSDQS
jgi:hypothetical protein